jgi:hypothetical protein
VYLKPADHVRKARDTLTALPASTKGGAIAKQQTRSFFDSWLAIAAVVCTGLGLAIRIFLNLFVWH